MRLLLSGVLLVCVASCFAMEAQDMQAQQSRKKQFVAQARDGAHHGGGGGHGGGQGGGHGGGHGSGHSISHGGGHGGGHGISHGKGGQSNSYSAPKPSYHEEPAKDTGFYYYYYPVVPENNKKGGGLFSGSKGFLSRMMENIMYPIAYPFMRMYDYFGGRSMTARAYDYLPIPLLEKMATMIQEELYKEECLERTICQLGKSAEGYGTFLDLSEFFVPEDYQRHLRIFKDSALKKKDCSLFYKCKSMSRQEL